MLATRFICARKSRHRDHRGEIRQRSAAVTFADAPCIAAILDRAYERQPEHQRHQFKRAIDMTDDELAAIASGATLHVVK